MFPENPQFHRNGLAAGIFTLLLWALGGASGLEAQTTARLDKLLEVPPVMRKVIGNPVVRMHNGVAAEQSKVTLHCAGIPVANETRLRAVTMTLAEEASERRVLAEAILASFWDETVMGYAEGRRMPHLIPMDRERFLKVGTGQLLGEPVGDAVGNAWWRVRMGLPLTPDSEHHIMAMGAKSDAEFYRHFSLGVRKTGGRGAEEGDFVLDPRAPWLSDEHPEMNDWFNEDGSLMMRLEVVPLADWMHTQTTHRGMKVVIDFMPATKEYVTLLRAGAAEARLNEVDLGPFAPLRNNCATHGQEILEALMPLNERLAGKHPIADLPKRVARKASRQFDSILHMELPAQPAPEGKVQSQNSTVHRPKDRTKTPEVLRLLEVPEIN